jgi:hypothetical protein
MLKGEGKSSLSSGFLAKALSTIGLVAPMPQDFLRNYTWRYKVKIDLSWQASASEDTSRLSLFLILSGGTGSRYFREVLTQR